MSKENVSLEKQTKLIYSKFQNKDEQLNKLNKQLDKLNKKLNEINNKINEQKFNNDDINNLKHTSDKQCMSTNIIKYIQDRNDIMNKIDDLQHQINNIQNDQNEIKFISENGYYIDSYYDNINNPQILENSDKILTNKENKKNILKFFKVQQNQENKTLSQTQIKYCIECKYNDYLNNKQHTEDYMKCEVCGSDNILNVDENIIFCSVCGAINNHYSFNEEIVNETNNKSVYPYKRLNHFIEWLNNFQGKETIVIPIEIYDKITNELNRLNIQDKSLVNIRMVKNILKKYKLHTYYEHVSYITAQISGIPPPTLSHDTEEYLKTVFIEIEKLFEKYKPKNRMNFLSYPYVLHKIFQIHGNTKVLCYFPLLKSKEKIKVHDKIWEKICGDMGWPFYPSIVK